MNGYLVALAGWIEKHALPCFYKKYLGIECPGCGMQRALIELFRGNIADSFHYYPACMPIILMMIFLILHLTFRYRQGAHIIKWMFTINAILIISNYIYKQI